MPLRRMGWWVVVCGVAVVLVLSVGCAPESPELPTPTRELSPPVTVLPLATFTPSADRATGQTFYTVQTGDTLSGIAERFATTVAELVRLNDLDDPDSLGVGQELKVPQPSQRQ